jgi:hypothetical protein
VTNVSTVEKKEILIINYIHEIDYPRMDKVLRKLDGKTFKIVVVPYPKKGG